MKYLPAAIRILALSLVLVAGCKNKTSQNLNTITDLAGRKVETLIKGFRSAGYYSITWDASALSSGVYFYRMKTRNFTDTRKMILMK